jgi:very-short-patch-repair endonuclease
MTKKIAQTSPSDKENLGSLPYMPYNTSLKELSRANRKNPTKAESKIWNEILKNDQLKGLRFNRQKPIDQYIVDFYCPELMLVIEIDGNSHAGKDSEEYDENRTIDLKQYGIRIIRYTNSQVLNDIEFVKKDLLQKIKTNNQISPLDKGGGPMCIGPGDSK